MVVSSNLTSAAITVRWLTVAPGDCAKSAYHRSANARQRRPKSGHTMKFGFVARCAPVGMVQVLFAASRIASGGLKMPVLRRANPNAAIGGRNGEIREAFAFRRAENGLSIIVKIRKALTSLAAANSREIVTAMVQSRRHCRWIFYG
jgi:hypothetical protein